MKITPKKFRKPKGLKILVLFIVLTIIVLYTRLWWLPKIGYWLAMPTTFKENPAEVIIVHGGNPDRTHYGISLYQNGLAPELWQTGYATGENRQTAIILTSNGVPKQAFHYLVTTSTWSDGTAIAQMIRERKLHNVIIITDWWHSRRALCSTQEQLQGYNVTINFAPSPSPAEPANWWEERNIRKKVEIELVKMLYYVFRYGWTPWGC